MQPQGSLPRKATNPAESVYLTKDSMPIQAMDFAVVWEAEV